MKIKPEPGYALLQIVKADFKTSKPGIIEIPMDEKDSSFFSRYRVIRMGKSDSKFIQTIKEGDIVIVSVPGVQMAVPGMIRNDEGNWIDVSLVSQLQIIATIEGDIGEDIVEAPPPPMIVPPTNIN